MTNAEIMTEARAWLADALEFPTPPSNAEVQALTDRFHVGGWDGFLTALGA